MPSASKLLILFLNIYFNLAMINPCLENTKIFKPTQLGSSVFNTRQHTNPSPEAKIDSLMHDYVKSLSEIRNIQDEAKALTLMNLNRKKFMQRACTIRPELTIWLNSLSDNQVKSYKEKMMLKPYFKMINDMTFALSTKLENKPELRKSFEAMDDFMTMLYN